MRTVACCVCVCGVSLCVCNVCAHEGAPGLSKPAFETTGASGAPPPPSPTGADMVQMILGSNLVNNLRKTTSGTKKRGKEGEKKDVSVEGREFALRVAFSLARKGVPM